MSAIATNVVGIFIIVLTLVFVGIWIWAWLPHHKRYFDVLARMPMLDLPSQNGAEVVTPDGDRR